MERNDSTQTTRLRRADWFQIVREIVFLWNVVSAAGYGLMEWVFNNMMSMDPKADADYYFFRAAVRINDFLHLGLGNEVTTKTLARLSQGWRSQAGRELAVLISVVAVIFILLLFVRLIPKRPAYRVALNWLSFFTALFAAPACYLCSIRILPPQIPPVWQSSLFFVFGAEIFCAGILWFVYQAYPFSVWTIGVLSALHFGLWIPALWVGIPVSFHAANSILIAFPLSGIVSLLRLRDTRLDAAETGFAGKAGKWTMAGAGISVAMLVLIWSPGRGYNLADPKDINSFTIQTERGACYGRCPVYRIVLHGSGLVEYFGDRHVRVRGYQTATVSREQISQILRDLDRLRFFTIEDRAFRWCFDTPSVGVSVFIDGKTKRVVSDAACTGAESGIQARFVQVAREIDTVTGSDRWVECDYGACQK